MKAILFASVAFLCGVEGTSSAADDEVGGANKCSLYLAKSTIENSGLGIFTGIPLDGEEYIGFGDLSIPIFDIDFHANGSRAKEDYHWLLDEYVWQAAETGPDMELEAEEISAFVTGMGSMPNCHLRLKNVAETYNKHDTVGVSRTDPGVGAFSPYHNRSTYTLAAIEAGSELFVDYGPNWFLSRESDMGMMPLISSYPEASKFMKSLQRLVEKISTISQGDSDNDVPGSSLEGAMSDLFDIIKKSPYKSRPLMAIPKSFSVAKRAFEVGIQQTELEQSIRSLDYLENHGRCLDNIRPGKSSIPHAGRGSIATRFIQKDSYVSIAPLMNIPDRDVLNMYADKQDPKTGREMRDLSKPTGHQLLLNYCFGHKSSSLLLCPYDPGTPYVNHNSESPNAKFVWSDDPIYHNSSWLDEPVSYFDNVWHTGLAFEYIAISDIKPGDEITVDYGPEWEEVWTKHIQQWQSPKGAESYFSPQELNENPSLPIPTHDEDNTLIGENIDAWCHFSFGSVRKDKHVWRERDMSANEHLVKRIIDRTLTQLPYGQSYIYTLELVDETDGDESGLYIVKNVPRKALSFYQKNYRSDMFIKGVFRHEMMIPDAMFPDAWKNIVL